MKIFGSNCPTMRTVANKNQIKAQIINREAKFSLHLKIRIAVVILEINSRDFGN